MFGYKEPEYREPIPSDQFVDGYEKMTYGIMKFVDFPVDEGRCERCNCHIGLDSDAGFSGAYWRCWDAMQDDPHYFCEDCHDELDPDIYE